MFIFGRNEKNKFFNKKKNYFFVFMFINKYLLINNENKNKLKYAKF